MITSIEKNRLANEKDNLIDDVAEESRLANITPHQAQEIVNLINQKYEECLEVVNNDEYYPEDVIKAFRGLIHRTLKCI